MKQYNFLQEGVAGVVAKNMFRNVVDSNLQKQINFWNARIAQIQLKRARGIINPEKAQQQIYQLKMSMPKKVLAAINLNSI